MNIGPIKWLGGYVFASIAAGFMVTRLLEAVWGGAPEIVRAVAFRGRLDSRSDKRNDE
tara:strand:+ start:1010 stop:1183 length:174 start_codon:yes stop_codon:yes gene_type:complete